MVLKAGERRGGTRVTGYDVTGRPEVVVGWYRRRRNVQQELCPLVAVECRQRGLVAKFGGQVGVTGKILMVDRQFLVTHTADVLLASHCSRFQTDRSRSDCSVETVLTAGTRHAVY